MGNKSIGKYSKSLKFTFVFFLFLEIGFLNSAMSQTLSAVSGESKNIADDQWLEQLRVNLTTTLRKDEIAILAKQLGLNDQQVVDIKTFNTLVRQANRTTKKAW